MSEQNKIQYAKGVPCYWVIAQYSGQAMKNVLGLADQGVGYIVLGKDSSSVTVAFRYAGPYPIPAHLQIVDDQATIHDLENKRRYQQGLPMRPDTRGTTAPKPVQGGMPF